MQVIQKLNDELNGFVLSVSFNDGSAKQIEVGYEPILNAIGESNSLNPVINKENSSSLTVKEEWLVAKYITNNNKIQDYSWSMMGQTVKPVFSEPTAFPSFKLLYLEEQDKDLDDNTHYVLFVNFDAEREVDIAIGFDLDGFVVEKPSFLTKEEFQAINLYIESNEELQEYKSSMLLSKHDELSY